MKTITTLALALIITAGTAYSKPLPLSNSPISKATSRQIAEVFGTFHIHRQGNFASLNWNVTTGNVASFRIERSYDTEFFLSENIATVVPSDARWNRYIDQTVEPGVIYYRIIAVMNDGSEECSAIESVKIVKHK